MKLSITVTDHAWSDGVDGLRRVVELADQGGIDTIWVPDHLFQADPTSHPQAELFEGFSLLGYLAAITSRVRLGMLVSPVPFRPPAVQVKAIATLDAFTRGRAWFGVGIGWEGDEARAMGIPLGPAKERFEQLEELLDIADRMFAGDSSPYAGKHFQLDGPICSPRPAGHVPVLIGGTGEQKTLRMVARRADACNLFDLPDGGTTVRHKLDVLRKHCDDAGRPYDDIAKTLSTRLNPGDTVGALIDRCREQAAWGIDHAIVIRSGPWTSETVGIIADAAPEVASL
ncbi:alkanesulfonate monooxygenase SsuD/methylene tetrahydromethanopterin reductase-like flavin-dependent oxidoreductase (luciferase family) [Kribbella pratensis]|uniref:Alkanesulfonate monooxygenase SsuD/methylene tetrahydromethanopterin reductase-like flavin-dependent oxidoreductase (Luciferase family) n=1 Tax=Kribbella pratensis TaxID=2512112 RepID=A0ABY2FC47_9ACTN|nr:LLM class flavin-dependent oxidoreductase [Kribbella pratensis]TDW88176.1 alkanesulfonate monooxygenase SsuD/methylene tetrahydromethanopterin reductase-like flavin-dependent oxidoreductase (luciferase family) [Kribbella pratensis]